jgi:TolB protein
MRRLRLLPLALVILACAEGTLAPQPQLAVSGRLERGMVIHVGIRHGADTTLLPVTALTVMPTDAATVLPNGDVRLTRAGILTISAMSAGTAASSSIRVEVPPMIVFDGLASGNRDIYRVAIDGGDLTRLTTNPANDQYPTASGSTILFTSFRDGNGELYTVAPDAVTERRITTTTFAETQAALSPDGRKVAYANNATGFSKVWLAPFDPTTGTLGAPARLSAASFGADGTIESTPRWAPASDRIVMMTTASPSGSAGLFTAPASAGSTPTLVNGSGTSVVEVEPTWSFDGFLIAYAAPLGAATEIFVRDTRTSVVTQLTRAGGSNGQPAYLADGRMVFTSFTGTTSSLNWVDPALPSDVHPIVTTGISAEHAAPVRP